MVVGLNYFTVSIIFQENNDKVKDIDLNDTNDSKKYCISNEPITNNDHEQKDIFNTNKARLFLL